MKNFLILLRYKVPIEIVEEHTVAHRAYLKTLYASGDLMFSGPFVPRVAGVLWARAAERSRVDAFIAQDPFFLNGVADYEVNEFTVTMHASSLDAAFPV